jgi:DNA-binding CsgD family transcriptional regulator
MKLKVPCHQTLPIHEALALKIRELKALGMTNRDIALWLKIDRKTVAKGLVC